MQVFEPPLPSTSAAEVKTFEEREVEYEKARARIFNQQQQQQQQQQPTSQSHVRTCGEDPLCCARQLYMYIAPCHCVGFVQVTCTLGLTSSRCQLASCMHTRRDEVR